MYTEMNTEKTRIRKPLPNLALGIALGIAFGVLFNSIALGVGAGIIFGLTSLGKDDVDLDTK